MFPYIKNIFLSNINNFMLHVEILLLTYKQPTFDIKNIKSKK